MDAAVFEIEGWYGPQRYLIEAAFPTLILMKLNDRQDLDCLLRMGREQEGPAGQKELDKLADLVWKYYSEDVDLKDLDGFHVELKVGRLICLATASGEAEIVRLKEAYPDAIVLG